MLHRLQVRIFPSLNKGQSNSNLLEFVISKNDVACHCLNSVKLDPFFYESSNSKISSNMVNSSGLARLCPNVEQLSIGSFRWDF